MLPAFSFRSGFFSFLLVLLATVSMSAQQQSQSQQVGVVPAEARDGGKSASVSIVVDASRSARGKMATLRKGALTLAKQFDSGDELALYFANEKPTLVQDFTGDINLIANKLKKIPTKGQLSLFDTLAQALDHARSDAANEQGAVVAFVNDLDVTSTSSGAALQESIRRKPGVPIYIIALKQSSWESQELAQKVAVLSGGTAYFPGKSAEVAKISELLAVRLGGVPSTEAGETAVARSLDDYQVLLVRSIPVADNGKTSGFLAGDDLILHRMLLSRLQKAKLFPEVRDASEMVDQGAPENDTAAPRELELLPMIVGYGKGGGEKRQFFSAFSGGSKLRVQVVLRDRSTREPITAFVEEAGGRLFGRNDEKAQAEAMMAIANRVVKKLQQMKSNK